MRRFTHPLLPLVLLGTSMPLWLPAPASGHLAMIRQGAESQDAPETDDRFGRVLASGDFNGDGFADLATAAPDESNSLINAEAHGIVVINEGSPQGLTHVGSYAVTVGNPADPVVRYGRALAVADFDQDGFDDLAVGLPDADIVSDTDAGQVFIHRGGAGGLQPGPSLILDQSDATGAAIEAFDNFGFSLATGDFNGDGAPDLAVGAIGEDGNAGAVFWFDVSGPNISLVSGAFMKQDDLGGTHDAGDLFGWALTAGDFDGNAIDDLAIGAPDKTVLSLFDAGMVYVVFGTNSGLVTSGATMYTANSLGLAFNADSKFGWALAAGQYWDPHGPADLAIGEPRHNGSGFVHSGRVVVLEFQQPPIEARSETPTRILTPTSVMEITQGFGGQADDEEDGDEFGYALASGKFDEDDWDELAVGVPFEDLDVPAFGTTVDAGMVHVYPGSVNGPIRIFVTNYTEEIQNDHARDDRFGQAVAFGKFDADSVDRQGLAVGAPDRDFVYFDTTPMVSRAGQVYIVAPWRQPRKSPHRSSVAFDCDQNIVYSQRMFQRVRPASTTKTLTLLLACEAIEGGQVDKDSLYTVPDWVEFNVTGSQVPLIRDEEISLWNLLKTMMTVSGNDAAWSVADILTAGSPEWVDCTGTVPDFNTMMNNKATSLGLSNSTYMSNPAGLDCTGHYTTALDFAKLAHAAMQSECVRTIVGTSPWVVPRNTPPWLVILTPADTVKTVFFNNFVAEIKALVNGANGVKGGRTTLAWRTGLWSSEAVGGEVIASAFGIRMNDVPNPGDIEDDLSGTGAGLLSVAKSTCEADDLVLPPQLPPDPFATLHGISTQVQSPQAVVAVASGLVASAGGTSEDVLIDVQRLNEVNPMVHLKIALQQNMTVEIPAGSFVTLGVAPYESHRGMLLQQTGAETVNLQVEVSDPLGGSFNFTLASGDTASIPPASGSASGAFSMTLTNVSLRETAVVDLQWLGFVYDVQLLANGVFRATMSRTAAGTNGVTYPEEAGGPTLYCYVFGQDATLGNTVAVEMRMPGVPSDVPEHDGPDSSRPPLRLALLQNYPNPFNPSTTIVFELNRAALVHAEIYDLSGRLVRRLESGASYPPGRWSREWDGRDEKRKAQASGIYIARLEAEGHVVSRKLVLVR